MQNLDLTTIADAVPADRRPAAVVDALAFLEAAQALSIAPAPDLTTATTKTLEATLAAAVEYDVRAVPQRARLAELVAIGEQRVETAWRISVIDVEPIIAEQFDHAAAEFTKAATALGGPDIDALTVHRYDPTWTPLAVSLSQLVALSRVRDAIAAVYVETSRISTQFTRATRTLVLPDLGTSFRLWSAAGATVGLEAWYLEAARTRGVVIKWQTTADQAAQADRISHPRRAA